MSAPCDNNKSRNNERQPFKCAETDIGVDNFGASTERALKRCRRALARMRVAVLKSIKSLVRDRVPAQNRRAVEARYANLLRRVRQTLAAVEAATVTANECTSAAPKTAVLLANIYRLENDLNDVDNERHRLIDAAATGPGDAPTTTATRT